MRDKAYSESAKFLADFFGTTTEQAVELRSFANESGGGPARPVFTRDMPVVEKHCERWDEDGRGMFFGVCTRLTGSHSGKRVDLAECPALWVDMDTDKLGLDKDAVITALRPLPFPPSVITDSGGGLHAYWKFNEAIDVRADSDGAEETEEAIVATLKQLAGICAGDLNVCDLARVLRLPGTGNSKRETLAANDGMPKLCRVIETSDRSYEFDDIVEWLDWQRPVVERPTAETPTPEEKETNPYLAAAKAMGFKPPLDVEQALEVMTYLGDDDTGIHQTQLRVSASLAKQGVEEDIIVQTLLDATEAVAGINAKSWNWKREERTIRNMVRSAAKKFGQSEAASKTKPAKKDDEKAKDDSKASVIAQVGEAAIAHWRDHRGPLMLTCGRVWTYADGYWRVFDEELEHILRVSIQGVARAMKKAPSTTLLNAAWRYVTEHPGLLREDVEWNAAGVIVCRNGVINPKTRKRGEHAEEHFATYRIEADLDDAAGCPIWIGFLESAFGNLTPEESVSVVDTLAEWFGAALVRGKSRELTKGLLAFGPSRTGKTQLAHVLRTLVGGHACSIRAKDLSEHFGLEPLISSSAWIADDAITSGEFLDAERYKIIVTGEPVSIPRKNRTNWDGHLDIPVCLTSNHLPRVKDQSHAVYNRSLALPMTVEYEETKAEGASIAERVISSELGGVLNWALEGYQRLAVRKYFDTPAVMRNAIESFEHDNNPIGAWLTTAVEPAEGFMVDRRDLLASLNGWMVGEYGDTVKLFGGRTLFPSLRRTMPTVSDYKTNGARYLTGLKLSEAGVDYIRTCPKQDGGVAGSGEPEDDINRIATEALF